MCRCPKPGEPAASGQRIGADQPAAEDVPVVGGGGRPLDIGSGGCICGDGVLAVLFVHEIQRAVPGVFEARRNEVVVGTRGDTARWRGRRVSWNLLEEDAGVSVRSGGLAELN